MLDLHGIIFAYHSYPALNDLVSHRTSSSLPFCARYRLIDFALSSMSNAGVRGVGVVMQKNYQSLMDHLEGGRDWDLSRGSGGLSLRPPYGTHDSNMGEYRGSMEALSAVRSYIEKIKRKHVVLFRGDLAINIDLEKVYEKHVASGLEITAVCTGAKPDSDNIRFLTDDTRSFSNKMHLRHSTVSKGLCSAEIYIINTELLLEMIDWCQANGHLHFHRDALNRYLRKGNVIGIYVHEGYARRIYSVADYFAANMDMLKRELREEIFPEDRPVYTKGRSSVSTYYAQGASVKNSLVADGCYIEGELENCIIFRGVEIHKGAKLKNCIIFQDSIVGENVSLTCVISDKHITFTSGMVLTGNHLLPLTVPKGMKF